MIDIKKSRYSKYILFSSLYFIQGLILTVSWVIIPLYFIKLDIPLPVTSLVIGVGMLPWSIKFFWGGIVDYFIEHGDKEKLCGTMGLSAKGIADKVHNALSEINMRESVANKMFMPIHS